MASAGGSAQDYCSSRLAAEKAATVQQSHSSSKPSTGLQCMCVFDVKLASPFQMEGKVLDHCAGFPAQKNQNLFYITALFLPGTLLLLTHPPLLCLSAGKYKIIQILN